MERNFFFDIHCHVMTLDHPNFINLLGSLEGGWLDLVNGGILSPSYILTDDNRKGMKMVYSVMNTLGAFEQPIDKTFWMMDQDLHGAFLREGFIGGKVYAPSKGGFEFRGSSYNKVALGLQLMDFSRDQSEYDNIYYKRTQLERINDYAMDTVRAIGKYHKDHPDGLFEFVPFIGVNPAVHSKRFIANLLERYVNTDRLENPSDEKRIFGGVKVYPPLGMNPWPEDSREEMEKVRLLYEFCQAYQIPITTHCDNQGFRGVSSKMLGQYTSPFTWAKVLKEYPDLVIDFAHFGYQYGLASDVKSRIPNGLPMKGEWFDKIISLMKEYPSVYTDLSYTGCMPEFYRSLILFLKQQNPDDRALILGRILFGSDFSVNLMKVQSYLEYYHILDDSGFDDGEVQGFVQKNPMKFLRMDWT
ncbi:MAG: amidohydrolase family protein [Sphaerochaetaceae bacterium]|nr:amidohydrolase family protein [Sphaerochaetaceae bacterium]MDD3162618.1 amidohydrolase family protein [Sphaerochaetaceae bacterium]MDD4007246.1 amidohydrolase family protein [Sphaerochaetaceae bacterium]MDD4396110.1 amidohydrolase family protein [Sphaerochaetaceae bacterium]